jgi:hypothetical protein
MPISPTHVAAGYPLCKLFVNPPSHNSLLPLIGRDSVHALSLQTKLNSCTMSQDGLDELCECLDVLGVRSVGLEVCLLVCVRE